MRMRMMENKDTQKIIKLEQQLTKLEQVVKVLAAKVSFLERENNRRKMESTQIANALRK
jgi:acetolactate synthase small subunit